MNLRTAIAHRDKAARDLADAKQRVVTLQAVLDACNILVTELRAQPKRGRTPAKETP